MAKNCDGWASRPEWTGAGQSPGLLMKGREDSCLANAICRLATAPPLHPPKPAPHPVLGGFT